MTSILSHDAFHASVAHGFGELLVLEQLAQLPPDSVMRVLQTIPKHLLQQALATPAREAQPRRKVLRGGKVMRDGALRLEVQVREIGDDGCRIWTRRPSDVPEHFSLRIVGIEGERRCIVRAREGEEIELAFLPG